MQTSINESHFSLIENHFFKKNQSLFLLLFFIFLFASCDKDDDPPKNCNAFNNKKSSTDKGNVTVFASGLNNPRGLKFGPDCHLFVAEAGLGGTNNTSAQCPQLVPSDGPWLGSPTGGRLSIIDANGFRTTATDKLPTALSAFGDITGVQDVAFIGNTVYALIWAGCGHSVPTVPSGIVRLNSNGTFKVIADLGAWRLANPVANPNPADADPEGVWHSMIVVGKNFYILDANHGELVKVTTDGVITRVLDISLSQGHIVPTVLDYDHGNFYVGNLGLFPIVDGSSNIYKITPGGQIKIVETGFTSILGLAHDNQGSQYILETTTGNPFPTPGTGRVVKVNHDGSKKVIATGFSNPTGMAYGPDGNLYVLNWGFGGSAGSGEVLKVTLHN